GHAVLLELADDLRADAAVPADDEVIAQRIDVPSHPPVPPVLAEPPLGEGLREDRERVEDRAGAAEDQRRREEAAPRRERMDLAETDGRDGRQAHVEGVER